MSDPRIDKILEAVERIDTTVADMKNKMDILWVGNYLDVDPKFIPSHLFHSKSPIKLTTTGQEILKEYGVDTAIESLKDGLISEIHKRDFKSPLDVQEFSEKLMLIKFNTNEFVSIKNKIFNQPTFQGQQINTRIMSMIMGLYLRDKYFEKYPELLKVTV